jgi:ribonuclease HI
MGSTVFSAEVMAILRCTELLLTKNLMRRRIHICFNSRAALAALAKTTTESSLVWECMQVLGKISELKKKTLVLIPGHQGILGNEEADKLDKEGANKVPPNHFTTMSFRVGKKLIKKQLELKHQGRWATCTSC